MPYPNEHAARLKPPGIFVKFRRTNDKFGKGVHAIWGITKEGKTVLESIRFDAKKFTAAQARKWLKDHGYKPIKFEPAVTTHAEGKMSRIENLTINVLPKGVRFETLEDRQHVVVPMVILTEGVHSGSFGPVYYPRDELEKAPQAWDHKPIVVYHPVMNGQPISACDPVVLNTRKVGVMLNTRYEDGKLKSEGWIDTSRVNKVDDRIMAAIEAGEMMELSTGLFVDLDDTEPGEWNGEHYTAIARNFRPDHLALLPDMVGACSIKDGAGFLRNAETSSISSLRDALQRAFHPVSVHEVGDKWVEEIFPEFFIYSENGKFYRIEYSFDGKEATIKGDPVEVVRETVYRIRNPITMNINPEEEDTMSEKKKEELIQELLNTGVWEEGEKEHLEGLDEKSLEKLLQLSQTSKEEPKQGGEKKDPVVNQDDKKKEPVVNQETEPQETNPVTVEQYIANAPKEIQEVLQNSLQIYQEEKKKLIDLVLGSKKNTFTKEELEGRPLGELRKIAELAKVEVTANADYSGQATPPSSKGTEEEPLPLPTLNFEEKK